ncbi:MAG TPA: ISNCY family transposase [Chloroflexota bacterium]|nr:ISNCY family transposase [Chloroflexota bacterium]
MNPKQQRQVGILTRLEAGALAVCVVAQLLGVSSRQVRRLRARFRQEGFAAVIHGNAARSPANRTHAALVEQILALAGPEGKYRDLNVCHLQELLDREEKIPIGRSTLDRLLKEAGLRQKGKAPAQVHRKRRLRREAEGMLLQVDGSPSDWLEGRGPKAALMGAIDDATGKVVFLLFRPTEDQAGYLLLPRTVASSHGLPMAIYHDRHTILRSPKQPTLEEELAGHSPMSQIQRVMAELGIESIPAGSPQAKGRIERLWGTPRDRLTKELRLADIGTLEQANAFLPGFIERYNARFAKDPQDPNAAWVPLPAPLDLNYYFAARETRHVRADNCISFSGQLLQLLPGPKDPSLVDKSVTVHLTPEGEIYLYHGKRPIPYRLALASDPAPLKPTRQPLTQSRPADPKAAARRRGWLFGAVNSAGSIVARRDAGVP